MQPYTFKAKLHHAWDGDTIWLIIDRGEGWQSTGKYRLFGVDTPEIRGKGVTPMEKVYAGEAKEFVEDMLRDRDLVVSTHKGKSKYDWMVEIWVRVNETEAYVSLAQSLLNAGHAVPYNGGTKLPWDERKEIQDEVRGRE